MAIEWSTVLKTGALHAQIGEWSVWIYESKKVPGKWYFRYVKDGETDFKNSFMCDSRDEARRTAETNFAPKDDDATSEKKTRYKHQRWQLLEKLDAIEAELTELRAMIGEKK